MKVNIEREPTDNFDRFVEEVIKTVSRNEHPGEVTMRIDSSERSITFSYQKWDTDEPEVVYYPYNTEEGIVDNIYYCVGRFFTRCS